MVVIYILRIRKSMLSISVLRIEAYRIARMTAHPGDTILTFTRKTTGCAAVEGCSL